MEFIIQLNLDIQDLCKYRKPGRTREKTWGPYRGFLQQQQKNNQEIYKQENFTGPLELLFKQV